MNNTVAFFLGYVDVRELALPGFREQGYCILCGSALSVERRRKLGVYRMLNGEMRGPVCDGCSTRWAPSIAECLDSSPRVSGDWPLEPVGYHLIQIESEAETDALLEELELHEEDIHNA